VIVRLIPAGTVLRLHGNAVVQSTLFETNVNPAGVGSVTITLAASLEPLLVTAIVKTALCPGTMLAGGVLTIAKSLLETMLVGSDALEFAVLVSPPPETLAVLVKLEAAVCATVTGIEIAG
jgi:hypothetical protein